ncbi:MAG: hypothetical protein GYA40_04940 [Chloroflexi bacterium]|nr:hypothetical protein [Chloroflexota bacterium]
MVKRKILSVLAAFLFISILAACASGASTPAAVPEVVEPVVETLQPAATEAVQPTVEASQPAETEAAQAPSTLSDAEMEALILQKLQGSPHTVSFILEENHTAEEWSVILDRMIGYGAKINAEEKQLIIDWLVSR